MRKTLLLAFIFLTSFTAFGQNFSNKGKEFWFCFPQHVPNSNANFATLSIFITSDQASSGTITMPNGAFSGVFNITANGIQEIQIPWNPSIHIRNSESSNETTTQILKKAIHIKTNPGQPAVVAYAQQWAGARSAATLLLPNTVLGKKYRAVSFTQNGGGAFSGNPPAYPGSQTYTPKSQFQVIAINDNTDVQITPVKNGVKGTPFTVNLPLAGDMIQYQSSDPAASSQDLTGTLIESVASGMGSCLPIAVFSGSSNNTFGTASPVCNGTSYDPLWQQCYPISSWGKNFGFIPFADYTLRGNPYRIMASEDNTNVSIDGVLVATLNAGEIYPNAFTSNPAVLTTPSNITADKPISVTQYAQADACSGQTTNRVGDPDMVILNPIEQNISDITVFTSIRQSITKQYINVVMKTAGTASFKINGANPSTAWQAFPTMPGYSFLRHLLSNPAQQTSYRLSADSGFNAIAYGWGNVESYAYSAGTNVRDLNTKLEVNNPNSSPTETDPSACTNSPFQFKVYFADSTNSLLPIRYDSIQWEVLSNASNFVPNNFPIMIRPTAPSTTIDPDSVNVRNGKYVAWYSLPGFYYVTAPGVYPIRITLYRSTNEGCGNSIEYEFNLTVSDPPSASFTAPPPGCYLEPVVVTETTPQFPKTTYKQWWEFYDPVTNLTTVYSGTPLRTQSHTFTTPGVKRIRHVSITTPGCISDTIVNTVTLSDKPNATIAGNTTVCINSVPSVPVTFTGTDGTAEYIFSYNINGGGTLTTPVSSGGAYTIPAPANVPGPFIYNLVGVTNALPAGTPCTRTITGQSVTVNILPDHTINLNAGTASPVLCINTVMPSFSLIIGGGATGISTPVNLPPGITATLAGNIVTLAGTPTVAGTYNYSITTTGNACLTGTFNGTITVNPDHSISLNGGNANPALCINTVMPSFSFLLGGGATGIGAPVNLPPGVTATVAGNIVTVSGIPTAAGTFNYSITTSGNACLTGNVTGTIIVNPDHTIAFNGGNASPTLCVNTVMPAFTLMIGGGATGIAAPVNLPPGVTASLAGNIVNVSGTPTVAGTYNYTITTSGNACLTASYTGTITVNDDATIALTSAAGTNNQTICINTAVTDIDYLVAGGGTGATIAWTPGTPAGINFIPLGGGNFRISGIPSATGTYDYTISTTGPCIKPAATGRIVVNPDHTISFNGGNPNPTLCVNTVMPSFTLLLGGGANNIITPAGLPPGVTATVAGNIVTIAGTPGLPGNYPYTITTSGNSCLTATYSNTINVTEDATISLLSGSDNQAVCRNTAIGNIDYTTGGSATGATISWAPSAPAGINFTPLGGGNFRISGTPTVAGTQTYTYTISTTGPCVKPTATGTVTVNALPVASFTAIPPGCANNNVAFNNSSTPNAAGTTTWSWDFGDPNANAGNPNTSSAQSPTHYYIMPNTAPGYTVTLSVVNSNGCISAPVASVVVPINDTPRAGFIVPDVCINDVATAFTDTSKINSGNIIRTQNQWNYGDGPPASPSNNSVGQNGSHLYPAPGIYYVTQIVTSNTGCKDTIVQPITINSADPLSSFTATNACSSDSVELTNLSTVGFGSVTRVEIQWDFVGNPAVVQTIVAPAFNGVYRHKYPTLQTTQTYTIRMTAYSGVICSNASTKTTTVYATPKVQFNNIPNTCYLVAPFQVTQGSEIGGVPGTGTYSGPGITNPSGTFNPQVAGIGTHNIKYTFTASNPGACIDTLTKTITVLDTAHARFSFVLPACEQTPVSFTDLSTAPPSVTLSNTVWDFGDGTGTENHAPGSTFTHNFALPGTYTVIMHNVSAVGCLSTDTSAVITIDANHHIALNSGAGSDNQTVCINTAIAPISYLLSGGATNVTIPLLPAGLAFNVAGNTLTITGSPTSTVGSPFNFTIQTTGNSCQFATAAIVLHVNPDHTIALSATSTGNDLQSVCVNSPIKPIVYDLGGGATGVGPIVPALPPGLSYTVTGNKLTITGTPTTTTGGPVYAITTTGNSCVQANASFEITVHPYPVPDFAFDKGSYCIPNAVVGFINNTTPTPLTNQTYVWDFNDGSALSTAISPTHQYTSEGPWNVKLTARSTVLLNDGIIGCASSKSNQLNIIHPQPKADFVFSKPSVCIGDNVTITDATDGKDGIVNQWHWDLGDGGTRVTNPVTYTYADTITYTITMYSVNTLGCNSDTISKPFTVYPYPHVNAGPDKFVLEGGSVELEASAFAREPVYTWTPVDYLTDSKILRPRVSNPKTDMTYRLTVTGKGGCQLSDDVFVKLLKFPAIPNTFTPNGDGINDQWRIDYLNTYPDNRVQIFTRAGKLVFESKGYTTPWDGTLKGKPLPFDTYYYIIEPGNGRDPITGYVTILK